MKKVCDLIKEITSDGSWCTASNLLTISRIFFVPVVVYGIIQNMWLLAFAFLIVATATDILDGYLARLLNECTKLGKCLDPLADKLLLISVFAVLSFVNSPSFSIPAWFVSLLFIRETFIIGGVLFLMIFGVDLNIQPSLGGKLTTFFQTTFILWIFVCYFVGWNPVKTYYVSLFMLAAISIASLGQYVLIGFRYFKSYLE